MLGAFPIFFTDQDSQNGFSRSSLTYFIEHKPFLVLRRDIICTNYTFDRSIFHFYCLYEFSTQTIITKEFTRELFCGVQTLY